MKTGHSVASSKHGSGFYGPYRCISGILRQAPKGVPGRTKTPPGHLVDQPIGAWGLRSYELIASSPREPDPWVSVGGRGELVVRLDLVHKEVPATGPLRLARLDVRYRSSEPHACSITLTGYGSHVSRTLSKFPWATWLAVADTVRRTLARAGGDSAVRRPDRKRPGRAGHGDDLYRSVARRYSELQRAESRAPTQTIAEEYGCARNTAAGWVRRARAKGFLPPVSRG